MIQGLSKTNNMSLYKERVRWTERDVCVRITVNMGRWAGGCRCCAVHMRIPYITLSAHGILKPTIPKQAYCKVQTAGDKCEEVMSVTDSPSAQSQQLAPQYLNLKTCFGISQLSTVCFWEKLQTETIERKVS